MMYTQTETGFIPQSFVANGALTGAFSRMYNDDNPSHRWGQERKFTNPTGREIRGCDDQGCGEYGASSETRVHEGVDYIAVLGQDVLAVSGGTITKIGYAYSDDLNYRYIQIDTTDNYRIHQFYVSPAENINVGTVINKGQIIGVAQSLGPRYPGITEHVHIEIRHNGRLINPTLAIP